MLSPRSRIRTGALLVVVGELAALATQFHAGPLQFIAFIVVGGGLTVIGALIAIWGMLSRQH